MALIKWRPFHDIEDRLFDDLYVRSGQHCAADLYETKDAVCIEMNVPGFKPDAIDISLENDHVRVSGSREDKEESEGKGYYHKEIRRGDFERIFTLPCPVDSSKTTANFNNGVLTIVLSKKQPVSPDKIKIEVK